MIPSSLRMQLTALGIALAAHGALAFTLSASPGPRLEGAAGGATVRLGNSFADMTAGTMMHEKSASRRAEPVRPERPERPDRIGTARPKPATPANMPEAAERIAAHPIPSETPATPSVPVAPVTRAASVAPAASAALAERAQQVSAAPSPDETKPDRIEATDPETSAVARSPRPKPRDPAAAPKPRQAARSDSSHDVPADKRSAKAGSKQNARAGQSTGQQTARATNSGSGRQQTAGNAARSNFPGLVMQRLSRAGKPRVNARGAAIVAFTITGTGGLSSVSLARSSGHAGLDRAAVQLVRGAAPFPEPPAGAQRSFSIRIEGG